jgi:L,D-peptidoglycan transpeptidase YkuD (ErfK/YbiS/YcfS/YnhG family)
MTLSFAISTGTSATSRTVAPAGHLPEAPCDRPGLPATAIAQRASEIIDVTTTNPASSYAELTLYSATSGCLRRVAGPFAARVGLRGLSLHHHEGDGTTPIGVFAIGLTMYGIAPDPGLAYHYHRLVCGDWWDEDPTTPKYNQFVHVPCGARPAFGGGSEALWTESPAYDEFAVIDYNAAPVVPGKGSAIFLHVAGSGPTDGCVAIAKSELVMTLRWLRPNDNPVIAIDAGAGR